MYGFSQLSAASLIGAELVQVCVGANEVILNFHPDGTRISIFDAERFFRTNGFMFEPIVSGARRRIRQLGKTIQNVRILDSKHACILMSDGSEIKLEDFSDQFESITFEIDGKLTVV